MRSVVLLLLAACATRSPPARQPEPQLHVEPKQSALPSQKEERPAPSYAQALDRGDLGQPLDQVEMAKGMAAVKPRVHACWKKLRVKGVVTVSATISSSGTVTRVIQSGKLAHTPTGECVVDAVRSAHFRKFEGGSVTTQYTYELP